MLAVTTRDAVVKAKAAAKSEFCMSCGIVRENAMVQSAAAAAGGGLLGDSDEQDSPDRYPLLGSITKCRVTAAPHSADSSLIDGINALTENAGE